MNKVSKIPKNEEKVHCLPLLLTRGFILFFYIEVVWMNAQLMYSLKKNCINKINFQQLNCFQLDNIWKLAAATIFSKLKSKWCWLKLDFERVLSDTKCKTIIIISDVLCSLLDVNRNIYWKSFSLDKVFIKIQTFLIHFVFKHMVPTSISESGSNLWYWWFWSKLVQPIEQLSF